jgi:hypothetical protein
MAIGKRQMANGKAVLTIAGAHRIAITESIYVAVLYCTTDHSTLKVIPF